MSETIAGDIRRIRKLLRPVDGKGIEVKCNYGELLTLFDAIETKAKAMRDENAKLKAELMVKYQRCYCSRLASAESDNIRLKAALKPVLDIVMDDATSDLAMAEAID